MIDKKRISQWGIPAARGARVLLVLGLALLLGAVIAGGGLPASIAFGVLTVTLVESVVLLSSKQRLPKASYLAVEVPMTLLLLGTLVLRIRDAETLAQNPLDSAGLFRLACIGGAGLLGIGALLVTDSWPRPRPLTTRPFRLYWPFLLVVFFGALLSVNPGLTAYRGLELAAGLLVLAGACNAVGLEAITRIKALLYWFVVGLVSAAWFWVLVSPGDALERVAGRAVIEAPLPVRLVGVFPVLSANLVGTLGVILLVWSVGRIISHRDAEGPRPGTLRVLAVLGLVTVIAAQYRTGYVAAAACCVVFLLLRKKVRLAAAFGAVVVVAGLAGVLPGSEVEQFVLRGQPEHVAASLSGRAYWWEHAVPVWQSSPLVGKGLLTSSRFEVLDPLGLSTTATIHGTWIETMVGTGLVGTGLLLASLAICWRRALIVGLQAPVDIVPALLLTVLSVRSLTANTIESFGLELLLFLVIALGLRDPPGFNALLPLMRSHSDSDRRGPSRARASP